VIWLGVKNAEELISNVTTLSEEEFEIKRENRTASGKLVVDIIAVKKKFTLNYNMLINEELDQLIRLYKIQGTKSLVVQRKDGTKNQYNVFFQPFARENFMRADEWHFSGVSIVLEEV